MNFTLILSKIHSLIRLSLIAWGFNKTRDLKSLKEFSNMMAFKPFKKGLGVYFQKGFVFLCFHISIRSLKC
ncbi:hypothetical protein HPHPP30_0617 [Helicobacter pylori Hp P-30]|nr:hypothetical protein HPHPP30_0617 [Helicobacter pylori Hp P-30]RVY18554.1 hypothetical protein ECB95_05450 [Helicobacter pylori]RVY91869.1 hypothetical protein EC502_05095 [Helicobacter pylori]